MLLGVLVLGERLNRAVTLYEQASDVLGGLGAYAFLAALCASNNFISHSNPVISMITGPAGYRAGELWRNGLPITLLYLLVSVLSVNLMF